MKQFTKRTCAMLLALVMCLSLISGIPFEGSATTVDYVYDGSIVYNWGQREETCTFLSPMAEDFYADNGYTYDFLASLSGASSTSDVPDSALYERLQELMVDNHSYINGYDYNKTHCKYTDCQNSGGKISSFYSGLSVGPTWDGTWNREHTWPNSKGLGGSDENDIMMIRPTSYSENGDRGNTAYGESSGYYDPNDVSGGAHNLRGDCARIWLYVYVRWGNTGSYAWGKSGVMESKEVLLKWMEEDPVDTWEMGRNDSVQSMTGTRNVFVDYPELAFLMFNEDVPAGYTSPSGEGNTTSYSVTAVSNNTSYGTVSCTGRTITATPVDGYYVQGYTVTSGTATVTQSGNTFNVLASSDCTIQINFAAKAAASVAFYEDGAVADSVSCYEGDYLSLPAHSTNVPEGYTFKGWVAQQIEDTATEPAVYAAGEQYLVTGTQRLYALYYYRAEGTGSSEYVLTDISQISATDEVVITATKEGKVYGMTNDNGSSNPPVPVEVTVSDERLTQEPADNLKWNISNTDGKLTIYPNGSTSTWLYCISKNNGVRVGTDSSKEFVIDSATGYLKHTGTSRYLGIYAVQDWRCYTATTTNIGGQTLGFYVKGKGGTTYYTTATGTASGKFAIWSDGEELAVYKELGQALANYDPSGEYIKLLDNAEVDVVLDDNVYIDLNGFALTGTMEPDGCTVYGIDTTTDKYSCDAMGYFACVDAEGNPVVPAENVKTSCTGAVKRYMTIETEDGYTFHRFYMGITHANLKPGVKGVGYKAVFAGDDMVKACVDSFGYNLQLGTNTPVTRSKAGTELVSLDTVTLRVDNYDADRMGTTELTANVFMVINGETVSSSTVTITLKSLVEQINAANNLDANQKEALAAWIAESAAMQSWDVSNIYTAE